MTPYGNIHIGKYGLTLWLGAWRQQNHYLNESWLTLLTHWGPMTHICVSKLTIIGSCNGLSSGRRQAIIWSNARISLIGPLGTNFSEILIEIYTFSFKKMHLKMLSRKWRPFCLSLNVLKPLLHLPETNGLTPQLPWYLTKLSKFDMVMPWYGYTNGAWPSATTVTSSPVLNNMMTSWHGNAFLITDPW